MWEEAWAKALSTLLHVFLRAGFRPYRFPVTIVSRFFSSPSLCLRDQIPTRHRDHTSTLDFIDS